MSPGNIAMRDNRVDWYGKLPHESVAEFIARRLRIATTNWDLGAFHKGKQEAEEDDDGFSDHD